MTGALLWRAKRNPDGEAVIEHFRNLAQGIIGPHLTRRQNMEAMLAELPIERRQLVQDVLDADPLWVAQNKIADLIDLLHGAEATIAQGEISTPVAPLLRNLTDTLQSIVTLVVIAGNVAVRDARRRDLAMARAAAGEAVMEYRGGEWVISKRVHPPAVRS